MSGVILRVLSGLLLAAVSVVAVAEQKQQIGQWDVHYSAFNSTFLTPEIAAQYGITRSDKRGLVNISVLHSDTQSAVRAKPEGYVSNPRGGVQNLEFQEITEGDAIYYLASFQFGDEEVMRFTLRFPDSKNAGETLTFEQQFYHE